MKTQQCGLHCVANALLAAVGDAVSLVLALLEMGRLKLGGFAVPSPACSAGITQHRLQESFLPPQVSEVRYLRWTLTSKPNVAFCSSLRVPLYRFYQIPVYVLKSACHESNRVKALVVKVPHLFCYA